MRFTPKLTPDFLSKMGNPVGSGYQGKVYQYGDDGNKVVKVLSFFGRRGNMSKDVNNEIVNSMYASQIGVGPRVYDVHISEGQAYIVMEKVSPSSLSPDDVPKLIELIDTMIKNCYVSVDTEFAFTSKNKLVCLDQGVSFIVKSPREAYRHYLEFLEVINDFNNVPGIHEYFLSKKYSSPSPVKSK